MANMRKIWTAFCNEFEIMNKAQQLFEHDANLAIHPKICGGRHVLMRTESVDSYLKEKAVTLREDFEKKEYKYDGILYMMFRKENEAIIPLYIGKSEKIGKRGGLSSLLKGESPKPRWDDGPDYHVGGLSTCVCKGYPPQKVKKHYQPWAKALFTETPSAAPVLKQELYLWIGLWETKKVGLWKEFGATSLCFQETLLINLAHALFERYLLNTECILRKQQGE